MYRPTDSADDGRGEEDGAEQVPVGRRRRRVEGLERLDNLIQQFRQRRLVHTTVVFCAIQSTPENLSSHIDLQTPPPTVHIITRLLFGTRVAPVACHAIYRVALTLAQFFVHLNFIKH